MRICFVQHVSFDSIYLNVIRRIMPSESHRGDLFTVIFARIIFFPSRMKRITFKREMVWISVVFVLLTGSVFRCLGCSGDRSRETCNAPRTVSSSVGSQRELWRTFFRYRTVWDFLFLQKNANHCRCAATRFSDSDANAICRANLEA